MTEVERLEQEAEHTRQRVSGLLEELKERAAPSKIMEDIVDHARESARNAGQGIVRNLSERVQTHPIPYTLIGAGLAWLIVSALKGRSDPYATPSRDMYPARRGVDSMPRGEMHAHDWSGFERGREAVDHAFDDASQKVTDAAGRISHTVTDTADRVSSTVSSTAAAATERASGLLHDATRFAGDVAHRASSGIDQARFAVEDRYHGVMRAGHDARDYAERHGAELKHYVEERPLVMAGLGVALGAALGAALPNTRGEHRLLGDTSARLKDRAREAAGQQIDRLGSAAEKALRKGKEAAQQEAERQLAASSDSSGSRSGEQMGGQRGQGSGPNAAE
jgi:hypothetical protein